jgi:DNA polymerase alpha subunit B
MIKRCASEIDPIPPVPSSSEDRDTGSDAMANVCRHLLQQRRLALLAYGSVTCPLTLVADSFYPIFPVPLEMTQEVNLDVTHAEGLRLGEGIDDDDDGDVVAPDVLVVPSRLKSFSKVCFSLTHCAVDDGLTMVAYSRSSTQH